MTRVRFENVGRDRKTWEVELCEIDYPSLYQAVKKKKALASKEIDFDWIGNDDTKGIVLAGGREVGRFTILPNEDPTPS